MKVKSFLIVLTLLGLILSACGSSQTATPAPTPTIAPVVATATMEPTSTATIAVTPTWAPPTEKPTLISPTRAPTFTPGPLEMAGGKASFFIVQAEPKILRLEMYPRLEEIKTSFEVGSIDICLDGGIVQSWYETITESNGNKYGKLYVPVFFGTYEVSFIDASGASVKFIVNYNGSNIEFLDTNTNVIGNIGDGVSINEKIAAGGVDPNKITGITVMTK